MLYLFLPIQLVEEHFNTGLILKVFGASIVAELI